VIPRHYYRWLFIFTFFDEEPTLTADQNRPSFLPHDSDLIPELPVFARRSMAKITKRSVDAAAAGQREFFIWDEELKGFGLRVYPSGRKMYLAQFRAGAGFAGSTLVSMGRSPPMARGPKQ
jgi:hypothetical protein